jgi:V8-like Glu-specific endopeptidase
LRPDTIFDLVTTNDIIGGSSGSPLLNAKAEVIGTAFDGNIESLGGDYGYDARANRTVAVSAAAITEALQKVYGADALVSELTAK